MRAGRESGSDAAEGDRQRGPPTSVLALLPGSPGAPASGSTWGGAVTDRGARGWIGEKRRQITRQSRVVRRAPRGESLGTNSPSPCLNSNIHHHTFPNHWHHHTFHCGGLHIVSPTRPPLKRHWFGVMDGRKPWAWKDDLSPTRGSVGVGASRSQCELALLPPWTTGFEQTAT